MSPASRARPSTAWASPPSRTSSASSTASRSATTSSIRKCWAKIGAVGAITFSQTLTLVVGLLYLEKRVSYRRLHKESGLDDETLEDPRARSGGTVKRARGAFGTIRQEIGSSRSEVCPLCPSGGERGDASLQRRGG